MGADGSVPWHVPEDLRRFRRITSGHSVVMGGRTWQSVGTPFPERQNIVVGWKPAGVSRRFEFVDSLEEAFRVASRPPPIFVIGGLSVYVPALRVAQHLYLTEIHHDFDGDVVFPRISMDDWLQVRRERRRMSGRDGLAYDFVDYVRRDAAGAEVSPGPPRL